MGAALLHAGAHETCHRARSIRVILVALLWFSASTALAASTIQCETYTVRENLKTDRTVFALVYERENSLVRYEKISGPDWFLPSGSVFRPIWVSPDEQRVVAGWIAADYGKNEQRWSPVYIIDIDFARPRYEMKSFGGLADFGETVYSLWNEQCRRVS